MATVKVPKDLLIQGEHRDPKFIRNTVHAPLSIFRIKLGSIAVESGMAQW